MTEIFNKKSESQKRKSLRRNMPESEVILWSQIKNKNIRGLRFRRQVSVGRFVVDFYCPELKLAIEIDGDSHFTIDAVSYDRERQDIIEIKKNLSQVLNKIASQAANVV
ncbi:MAG: DUF559 domain-containing protein [bacterium]|nr:DUF559 domain-containing protein [bacterium]